MALTRQTAEPLFWELLDLGFRARLVGWTPPTGWGAHDGHAFTVEAQVSDGIAPEAGVAAAALVQLADVGMRRGLQSWVRTTETETSSGSLWGATVIFE